MTDQPADTPLTSAQEADVRRLLAEARHTEATPEDVVARLDATLAELGGEPVREATVVKLADRRRKAGTMLVAAAAVIVAGVGLAQVLPRGGGEDSATSSADAGAAGAAEGQSDTGANELPGLDAPEGALGGANSSQQFKAQKRMPLKLSAQSFARDAAQLQGRRSGGYRADGSDTDAEASQPTDGRGGLQRATGQEVCDPGDWGRGRYVAVVYAKAPGWVVLRRPQGDSQIVDLFLCDSETAARSVTLPFR